MDVESTQCEDVAIPDQIVSGCAGTGQKNGIKDGDAGESRRDVKHTRVVIGLGVLYNGKILPCPPCGAVHSPAVVLEDTATEDDPVCSMSDREDRIMERMERAIDRFDPRIRKSDDRRRPQ